LIDHWNVDDAI